ncbi:MAG TPA: hypothetical protein VJ873_06515, partial [bacterium]|nr:hypothetical protein [bacterium]
DLKFKRTDDGFQVTQSDPSGGTFTGFFDKKGKMVEFLMQEGGSPTTVQPGFTNTQKGYLLTGLAVKASGTDQEFKIEYGVVDRYWLPKELGVKINLAEAGDVELHFHFSNYRVNQ